MKQEQRNLAWACLASAAAHGALIFLVTANFNSVLGAGNIKNDSGEGDSQETGSLTVSVELLPKPADVKKEKKPSKLSGAEALTPNATNASRIDSQNCPAFFGGIGMTYDRDGLVIIVPDGYPAARAGILPGDILKGDTERLRGEIGTRVDVVVIRGKKTLKFSMIREKICISEKGKIKL